MRPRRPSRLALAALLLAALAATTASAGHAVTVPFRTFFTLDTPGLPPGVGGAGQPSSTGIPAGSAITVVDSALNLENRPAELDSPTGAPTYLQWDIIPAVADLGVEIRFTVSFANSEPGTFFDAAGTGGVRIRLRRVSNGDLTLSDGCAATTIGSFTPGVPVAVIARFVPPSSVWVIADGEANGFEDNTPVTWEDCSPGNLYAIYAYAWTFGGQATTVAFDDLVVEWLPLLVADFEEEDFSEWTSVTP